MGNTKITNNVKSWPAMVGDEAGAEQAVWAHSADGVTGLAGCEPWHCRAAQGNSFPFPAFAGLTV